MATTLTVVNSIADRRRPPLSVYSRKRGSRSSVGTSQKARLEKYVSLWTSSRMKGTTHDATNSPSQSRNREFCPTMR